VFGRAIDWLWVGRGLALSIATLIVSTLAAYVLELGLGLADASPVYLLGVAAVAIAYGATAAVGTAVGAFLTYNFLFIEPRYTFAVAQPPEFLTLIVLLVIGILIGRLAGRQRDREQQAGRREREARALYSISRSLNAADSLDDAAATVVERMAREAQMERVWIGVSHETGQERILADSRGGEPLPEVGGHSVLRRDPAEGEAAWLRVHPPRRRTGNVAHSAAYFRVELRAGDTSFGSLWAARRRELGEPHVEESRLMAAAADQVAQAIRRQLLAASAAELEIASRSDELKSALLDSVSHDLRTPLATIRAAAGSLVDPSMRVSDEERIRLGEAIDSEADRLNRLVSNLLDMSRIEGGELHPDLELVPVASIVEPVLERVAGALISHRVDADLPDGLPAVWADPLMLDQVLTNLLENAAKYAPRGARIRVSARISDEADALRLAIEDGGAGVPADTLPRLFDKFYRAPQRAEGARRGTGLGLAVVQGLIAAMGGAVEARKSELGGLAIVIHLPTKLETGTEAAENPDFAVSGPAESGR
jgi:two-component system sensor histidine kinase KdpD